MTDSQDIGIEPLFNRIIIKRFAKETSIVVPEYAKTHGSLKASQGEVVAKGPDAVGVEIGEKIVWGKYAGVDIKVKKKGIYTMMNDEDILAKIKEYFDE
jgi:chaperonin GroES